MSTRLRSSRCAAGRGSAALPRGAARRRAFRKPHRAGRADRRRDAFSTEDARDRLGEAEAVMELRRGQAGHVGRRHRRGRGLLHRAPVADRRRRAGACWPRTSFPRPATGWRSASSARGSTMSRCGSASPTIPCCPAASFDRIFLVHMYHEVTEPYAFLWHLRAGLKPDGEVIVVDADRPVQRHGMPPAQLGCELAALGLRTGAAGAARRGRQLCRGVPRGAPAARARRDQAVRRRRWRDRDLEQPHPAEAAALAAGEHQMIDARRGPSLRRRRPGAGGAAVGRARGRIAARVVVGEQHARAAEPRRVGDDRAHRQSDRVRAAVVAAKVEAARLVVDMRDPQALVAGAIGEAGAKKACAA